GAASALALRWRPRGVRAALMSRLDSRPKGSRSGQPAHQVPPARRPAPAAMFLDFDETKGFAKGLRTLEDEEHMAVVRKRGDQLEPCRRLAVALRLHTPLKHASRLQRNTLDLELRRILRRARYNLLQSQLAARKRRTCLTR